MRFLMVVSAEMDSSQYSLSGCFVAAKHLWFVIAYPPPFQYPMLETSDSILLMDEGTINFWQSHRKFHSYRLIDDTIYASK